MLSARNNREDNLNFLFAKVWKLNGLVRVGATLWKIDHERLLFNEEWARRCMTFDIGYGGYVEVPSSILYIMRDCEDSKKLLSMVIKV